MDKPTLPVKSIEHTIPICADKDGILVLAEGCHWNYATSPYDVNVSEVMKLISAHIPKPYQKLVKITAVFDDYNYETVFEHMALTYTEIIPDSKFEEKMAFYKEEMERWEYWKADKKARVARAKEMAAEKKKAALTKSKKN